MLRPRVDVTERKLDRVNSHLARHPLDGYAAENAERLTQKLRTAVRPSAERIVMDKMRS